MHTSTSVEVNNQSTYQQTHYHDNQQNLTDDQLNYRV